MKLSRRQWLKQCAVTGLSLSPTLSLSALPRSDKDVQQLQGRAFGTQWMLTVPIHHLRHDFRGIVDTIVSTIDQEMSPYRPDSSITLFNRSRSLDWHSVSMHSAKVISASLTLAQLSDGIFDPSIGPLVNRFGFGPITGDMQPDYRAFEMTGNKLRKLRTGLTLDLCAIAKGYAIDLIANQLTALGVTDFLIECGGELRASGRHASGRHWQVGIEEPIMQSSSLYAFVELENQALATSALHQNAFNYKGRQYHHLIDSRQHEPVEQNLLSVSVLNHDAMLADGWATLLLLSGAEQGPTLARQHGIDALFVLADKGYYRDITTGSFPHNRIKKS